MKTSSIPTGLSKQTGKRKLVYAGYNVKFLGCCLLLMFLSGCASYGKVENAQTPDPVTTPEYSLRTFAAAAKESELGLTLTFSGGGTRAAALAYGVMQELRDTVVVINGKPKRLLDEVDTISSVSGGSFTSAYYGLHGDGIFETFEDDFLRYDMDKHLIYRLLNPLLWISTKGRTDMAAEYYDKQVFHGATFADMMKPGMPLIVINASDLAYGVRFSFLQEYFNLLCSDLASFSVARAVTASSAVPVMFQPVVVQNYSGCHNTGTEWLKEGEDSDIDDVELATLTFGLKSYANKDKRKYIHFVDGGITDNTGLRAIYDVVEISGGSTRYLQLVKNEAPKQYVLIAVNASTDAESEMDESNKEPSSIKAISAVTNVQLHRYNLATIELVRESLDRWAKDLSTPDQSVTPYFIEVGINHVDDPQLKLFLNKIPTAFTLSDEEVDALIKSGRELLRNHPVFQQLLKDIEE